MRRPSGGGSPGAWGNDRSRWARSIAASSAWHGAPGRRRTTWRMRSPWAPTRSSAGRSASGPRMSPARRGWSTSPRATTRPSATGCRRSAGRSPRPAGSSTASWTCPTPCRAAGGARRRSARRLAQDVADLGEQHLLGRRRGGRGGRLGAAHRVHPLHEEKDHEGEQDEVDQYREEVAVCEHGDAGLLEGLERHRGARGHFAERYEEAAEVYLPAQHEGDEGHEHAPDQRVHDLAEGSADDHADGEIHHGALHRELFEFRHHAHWCYLRSFVLAVRIAEKPRAGHSRAVRSPRHTSIDGVSDPSRGADVARGLLGARCKMLKSRVFLVTGLNLSEANP